jgi:Tol biopolymer transport system component
MKTRHFALFSIFAPLFAAAFPASGQEAEKAAKPDPAAAEAALLSGVRQLTIDGKRSGEGYFSADGSKMIFQSEREEGNPFYQIYLMDLETGDTERVSPGFGKTTCAWVHPNGKKVMFASTQDDPEARMKQQEELDFRASGKERRYSWDYDPTYEIFEYDLESKEYRNLTGTEGYDAEGAYSPAGDRIVFASNRQAFEGELSKEDADWFKMNKSFLMEIYSMNADGSDVKRLTNSDGYDGGPFFSQDGKKICWRRFDREGLTAEVYTMNADGSDQKQLTRLGAMSWAPYFHPSGEYLIFATNKHGFANFELYLVDAKGEQEPVRVTHTEGFDGLPVFSPDGKKLSWTSNRTTEKQSQIFIAGWDHEKALKLLGIEGGSDDAPEPDPKNAPDLNTTATDITVEDMRKHIGYLSSDELQGRLTGTPGARAATAYAAKAFESFGLLPAGDNGTYFQEFDFTAGVDLGDKNQLNVTGLEGISDPKINDEWRPITFSKNGAIEPADVVFAGYGIEMPAGVQASDGSTGSLYSSYFHLDVKGKWVMVLRYSPTEVDKADRERFEQFASLRHKALKARQKWAAGIIFVTGPRSQTNSEIVQLQFDASLQGSGIPAISISTEMAKKMITKGGEDFDELHEILDRGEMISGLPIPDVKIGGHIDVVQETRKGRNVLGRLPVGAEASSDKAPIIVGAHIDHLGPRAGRGSLAKKDEVDQIHNGADDNASGTSAMMEIAQLLASQKAAGKLDMKRDAIFAAWSGEELGLLGASHFVKDFGKQNAGGTDKRLTGKIAAYLNMDMVGRLGKTVLIQGVGSSSYWPGEIEKRNVVVGLPVTIQNDTYLPTDASAFYLRGVPILNAFTGSHADYHTPRDTADKINYEGAKDIARFMGLVARGLVINDEAPDFIKVEPPKNKGRGGFRVYLGTQPDYTATDVEGIKLSGVAANGPAEKAGIKGGDIIISMKGTELKNIYDLTAVMGEMKVGDEVEVKVKRGDEVLTLKVTAGSRD